MSCCFVNEDEIQNLRKELSKCIEKDHPILKNKSKPKFRDSLLISKSDTKFLNLPRGGCVIFTKIGPIQFGIPPETVKDSLDLNIEIPTYYIVPSSKWDKIFNISVAEFEFPAYFNFFIKKKKINLICTKEMEKSIKNIFQETLLGPLEFPNFEDDFDENYDIFSRPDLKLELSHFAKNPFNPNEPLKLETLIEFTNIDDNGFAYLPQGITIRKDEKYFVILDEDNEIAQIKDKVRLKVNEEIEDYSEWKTVFSNQFQTLEVEKKNDPLYKENYMPIRFEPPIFGVTVLGSSHGFDPKGNTSGYIIWINGRGVMVDPPPFSTHLLKKKGVPQNMIEWIIVTHCHADHDAGAFQKIFESSKVEVITTRTIMGSFIRKYAAIVGMKENELSQLFKFRPVVIGAPLNFNGASFNFFYSFHSIPCVGFNVSFRGKSIYFSADTFYEPEQLAKLIEKKIITPQRYEALISNIWNHDLIFHEAGVPPIHTPMKVLCSLSKEIHEKLFLVHAAQKDIPIDSGLKLAKPGLDNTISINVKIDNSFDILRTLDILCSIELFDKTNIKNVRDMLESAQIKKYSHEEFICKEGTKGSEFYIILNGIVKIFSNTPERAFERYCQVGDYFGESALKGIKYSIRQANVQAISEVSLLVIRRNDFWFIFGDNDEIINKLLNLMSTKRSKALNVISKNSLFSRLNSAQKIQMEMIMREKKIKKGEILWTNGTKPQFVILISKGEIEFFKCKEAEHEGYEIGVGTFIGEIDALINDKLWSTNLRAVTDCDIFVISKKDFLCFLKNNPGLLVLLNKIKFID